MIDLGHVYTGQEGVVQKSPDEGWTISLQTLNQNSHACMELLTARLNKLGTSPGKMLLDHQLPSWPPWSAVLLGWCWDSRIQVNLSLTSSTDRKKPMKTNGEKKVLLPSWQLILVGYQHLAGLCASFLNFSPSCFVFSAYKTKKNKAWLSHFNGFSTSLVFHSKRHRKAGWTSFL